MIEVVNGSLLESDAKYIAHQTNCVSERSAHLAGSMFKAYPYADVYSPRKGRAYRDVPGTIVVRGDGGQQRFVINMMGQLFPGKPKYPNSRDDGYLARKKYFHSCLKQISLIEDLQSIAFPYGVGCGAAGGDWDWYSAVLDRFAKHVSSSAKVILYKLSDTQV